MKISLRWPSLAFLFSFLLFGCDDEKVTPPDTAAPEITINEFGEFVKGTIPITISATDNIEIASMELSINGTTVASSEEGTLNYSWDTKTIEDGIAKLQVSVVDKSGNEAVKDVDVNIMNYFFRFNVGSGYAASDDSYYLYISDYDGNVLGTADLKAADEIKIPTPENYELGTPVVLNECSFYGKSIYISAYPDFYPGNYTFNIFGTQTDPTIIGEHHIALTGIETYADPVVTTCGTNLSRSTHYSPVGGYYNAKMTSQTSDIFFSLTDETDESIRPRFGYIESASVEEASEFEINELSEMNEQHYDLGFTTQNVIAATYTAQKDDISLELISDVKHDANVLKMVYPGELFNNYRFFYRISAGDLIYTREYEAVIPEPELDFLPIEITESSYVGGKLNLKYSGSSDLVWVNGYKMVVDDLGIRFYVVNIHARGDAPVAFTIAAPPSNIVGSDQFPPVDELTFDFVVFEEYEDLEGYEDARASLLDATLQTDGDFTSKTFANDLNTKKSSRADREKMPEIARRKYLTNF